MIFRSLNATDRIPAENLWRLCFPEDSDEFINLFFKKRFLNGYSVGCFIDDDLVSVVHGSFMPITCQNRFLPALMVSGVCTHPDYRGQGMMHQSMLVLQSIAEKNNIRILFNHPAKEGTYSKLGFKPCSDALYFASSFLEIASWNCRSLTIFPFSAEEALKIFEMQYSRYDAFPLRNLNAMQFKYDDCKLDGGEAVLLVENGAPVGYCLFQIDNDILNCIELLSENCYKESIYALALHYSPLQIVAKLPPDSCMSGIVKTQNVMLADRKIYSLFLDNKRCRFCPDEY